MKKTEVSIPCGTIILEGILEIPDNNMAPFPAAILCHPHPLYGGNMHNNVTSAMADGLLERGLVCLRFNFRGTGGSQGTHGEGVAEVDDVKAALDYIQQVEEVDPQKIVLTGYSFGCHVALRAASEDPRSGRLIGVSPPVDMYDFSFLYQETRPKLLMAGNRDFVCSEKGFQDLVEAIPEPKKGVILDGVDHFHFGREKFLVQETNKFLDGHPF